MQRATRFDLLAKKARRVAVHNASMADRLAVTYFAAQKVQRHVTKGRKSFILPFVFLDKEFELQSRRQQDVSELLRNILSDLQDEYARPMFTGHYAREDLHAV